jgi:hypothetical protein
LTATSSGGSFSTALSLGVPANLGNLFSITTNLSDQAQNGQTYTDNISVTFKFTDPTGGTQQTFTGTDQASISYVWWQGEVMDVAINWDPDPITVTFDDGSQLSINLADVDPDCNGYTQTDQEDVTFTLTKDPSSVPEPITLALLGTGLVGIGWTTRRRQSVA